MRHLAATIVAVAALAGAAIGRETIGIHAGWGAFRDEQPRRCFAIARPVGGGGLASAAVLSEPARGIRSRLAIRLSRVRDRSAPVALSVGERRFDLDGDAQTAWTDDPADDRAIVSAMRGARAMSVETADASGRAFADTYALKGAATAIDAAAVACLGG